MLCAHVSCIVAAENLELELVEETQGVVGKNISREEKGIV